MTDGFAFSNQFHKLFDFKHSKPMTIYGYYFWGKIHFNYTNIVDTLYRLFYLGSSSVQYFHPFQISTFWTSSEFKRILSQFMCSFQVLSFYFLYRISYEFFCDFFFCHEIIHFQYHFILHPFIVFFFHLFWVRSHLVLRLTQS